MSFAITEIGTQAYGSAEAAYTDWTVLDEEGVQSVARAVARQFGRDYALTLEEDDAHQEALVILATRARQARQALTQGTGVLHRWLHQRLRDQFLTEAGRRTALTSFDVLAGA
ncbi:hypothetical protein KME66_14450 [Streptomyces sp. YPW6]|uniref:hypothetical protein n=1 Tax=Streptomyces sp. YPW6 TaxID=2840373 RepID=UPI001C0BEB1E|nr:hypothetical protein [Streptomyces sp. YPW6]QWQ42075.1 hypothetical protein KME66_14450 [Streptomyces sp. YPW6]